MTPKQIRLAIECRDLAEGELETACEALSTLKSQLDVLLDSDDDAYGTLAELKEAVMAAGAAVGKMVLS